MVKAFANTLAIYLACLEILQMYQPVAGQYWYWVMPISKFPKLLCMKKVENQICVDFVQY